MKELNFDPDQDQDDSEDPGSEGADATDGPEDEDNEDMDIVPVEDDADEDDADIPPDDDALDEERDTTPSEVDLPRPTPKRDRRAARKAAATAASPAPEPETETAPPVTAFGQTRWVPFGALRLEYKHWTNPRTTTGLDDVSIKAMADSIRQGTTSDEAGVYAGVKQALKVVQIKANGGVDLLVIDGQRRCLGVTAAGLPDDVMVPVVDLEPEPVDWTPALATTYLLQALEEVGTRAGLSGFEISENALRLRAQTDPATKKPYTIAVIAGVIGRSESWVSKILSARESASPGLLLQWQKGEISEEMFKDLAALPKTDQRKKLVQVQELAKEDKGAARAAAKEAKEILRQKAADKKPEASDGNVKHKPVVRGPQQELPETARKPPGRSVIEDMLGMRTSNPPTHDYVKGVMDGIRWATGDIDATGFAKPWRDYMDRVVRGAGARARTGKAKKNK